MTLALVGGPGVLAYLGFDAAWRQFHFLAFTNDLWELDPATDHLIQMFPRDFWFDVTMLLGAFTLLEALLVGGLSAAYLYLTRWDEVEEQPVPPPARSEAAGAAAAHTAAAAAPYHALGPWGAPPPQGRAEALPLRAVRFSSRLSRRSPRRPRSRRSRRSRHRRRAARSFRPPRRSRH